MEPSTQTSTTHERSLLAAITYFDLFSYPLTPFEAWKWCYVDRDTPGPALGQTIALLRESPYLAERLGTQEGFYFLRGHDDCVPMRKERYLLAERKYQRVLRAVRAFRALPYIRLVAVCNTLAYSNTRNDGDLDLLIITTPGRIWTTRFFTTGLAKLLGWRPTESHSRDAVCLSFFLSEDALDLRSIALPPEDMYLRYWIDQLVPVYGDTAVLDRLRETNGWYRDRLPNAFGTATAWRRRMGDALLPRLSRRLLAGVHTGRAGDRLERRYRAMQERLLPGVLRTLANVDTRVVVNDHMLKFHENDRREAFTAAFKQRLAQLA